MEKDQIRPRSFGTHDGSFHADEVTACALLLLFDLIDRCDSEFNLGFSFLDAFIDSFHAADDRELGLEKLSGHHFSFFLGQSESVRFFSERIDLNDGLGRVSMI